MLTDVLLVLTLIAINGAFALFEIAMVSSKRARLVRMAETGNVGAKRALALASEPTRFLQAFKSESRV